MPGVPVLVLVLVRACRHRLRSAYSAGRHAGIVAWRAAAGVLFCA